MKQLYKNIVTFVWVTDTGKTKAFYTDVLGFNVVFESEGWIELSIPGTQNAFLALNRWAGEGKHPVNEYLTLSIDNLDGFRKNLETKRVPFQGPVREFPEHGMRMFKFLDPAGNVLTAAEVEG